MAVKKQENNNLGLWLAILGGAAIGTYLIGWRKGIVEVGLSDLEELYGYNPNILSRYFTEADVTRSAKANQLGINNAIDAQSLHNAGYLAQLVLDPISDYMGAKLNINGWFRNPQVNSAVGGTSTSDHLRGEAADVENPLGNNKEIIKTVLQYNIPFDQMIVYDSISNPSRIHLSYNPTRPPSEQVRDAKLKTSSGYSDLDLQNLWEQVS